MRSLQLFDDVIDEIAARLDLREPNRQAVLTINAAVSQYYDVEEQRPPFEAVIDSATGVGKTYILAGAMELFAQCRSVRDFVIVTPGSTILNKTRDNFTPGHPKSLLSPMSFQPTVITSDNFDTPAMRAAMDDPGQIKVYLFTVQSLIKPQSKQGRKVHDFREGLGAEFYSHLKATQKLVVFADEHHCYYGPAFSNAVRDLDPWVLIGLTATPDKKTKEKEIIFRYPLAAAIADKLVKTPVIVGRKDDRADPLTKFTDGVTLLRAKADALAAYSATTGAPNVNPVMLVVASDIDESEEYGRILASAEFFNSAYADTVLVVHSKAPDEALEVLARVEDDDSPVRIIISVGMLKEGWDVRNVYVVASMRASVSEILTEQTLGRGMRLPFGQYTGIELLDTLEVIAHERYSDLLKKRGVLAEAFVDYRTWAALRTNAQGQTVVVRETAQVTASPVVMPEGDGEVSYASIEGSLPSTPLVLTMEDRTDQVRSEALNLTRTVAPRPDAPVIRIPLVRMGTVRSPFSLGDITDTEPFRRLGAALSADSGDELKRTVISAHVIVGDDGIKRTELVRSTAADRIRSMPSLFGLAHQRSQLADTVMASAAVPARANQRQHLDRLLDDFFGGLGSRAEEVLSANFERVAARLISLIAEQQRRVMPKPTYDEVVELRTFSTQRATDKPVAPDRFGPFSRSAAYDGWKRSLYPLVWFDSEPERHVANIVDADDGVSCWLRLHINDLPILSSSDGRNYNPDLIVIGTDDVHWLVEMKMDKELTSADVRDKRDAAMKWSNSVNADPQVNVTWSYLLVSETDVNEARDSWPALHALGSQ